jgi:hypothetical protein
MMKVKIASTDRKFVMELNEFEAGVLKLLCGEITGRGEAHKITGEIYYFFDGHGVEDQGYLSYEGQIGMWDSEDDAGKMVP